MLRDGFRPAWWLGGPHGQTLGARLLRSRRGVTFRRERLELSDGDFVDLDWVVAAGSTGRAASPAAPLVLVLHGLEGSARSGYALEAYRQLAGRGLASVGLNFRSCSGVPNRLARLYHSGDTGDLRYVLGVLRGRSPPRPMGAVGFSLGGNVLLKYLGEVGESAASLLRAAVAISVPFDLAAGADWIERRMSRLLYLAYLMRRLRRKVRAKAALLAPSVNLDALARARTFREFDDAGTAPLHGFADADDYYRRSSAGTFLGRIRVPALLIHARDDPFLPAAAIPHDVIRANPFLTARLTARGGHVGFVAGPPWKPLFWAEWTAAEYLAGLLAT